MLPTRKPRLMARRREDLRRTKRGVAFPNSERNGAEQKRHHQRSSGGRAIGIVRTLGGWALSILGALVTSLLLTWTVRHPERLGVAWGLLRLLLRKVGL
jgi:hypothetical protein